MNLRNPLRYVVLSMLCHFFSGSQRPFFNIGHMANNIDLVETYLKQGCNVIASDIMFNPDGSVQKIYYSPSCDMGRNCNDTVDLGEYLRNIKNLTDPSEPTSFHKQLVMMYFNLDLKVSDNKTRSGQEVLNNIVEHLWTTDESRKQEVKVLLYIRNCTYIDFLIGFIDEIKLLGLEHRLKDVGFDCSSLDPKQSDDMFKSLNVSNVWNGAGSTAALKALHGDARLSRFLTARDSPDTLIQKVYDWTVNDKITMRKDLRMGVDGIVTKEPKRLSDVLKEPEFGKRFRMATIDDDPFSRFAMSYSYVYSNVTTFNITI